MVCVIRVSANYFELLSNLCWVKIDNEDQIKIIEDYNENLSIANTT